MLQKTYTPSEIEPKFYKAWEESGAFNPLKDASKKPYTIMMPPPNVTGSLHMGHALTYTLQDILIRYHRMQGYDVLWQPGTDHGGIATQMVVERNLEAEGLSRKDLGREKFLEKTWEWKEYAGNTIVTQMRRLGVSAPWEMSRFTLDDGLSHAVKKVFVDLYKQGLVYKDTRLVNWDPKLQTALSDVEVNNEEVKGHLWYIKYPIKELSGEFITIATTRPETMLGDTAVAVHPEDERYTHLVGKTVVLPFTNREIPIIADEYCDPEKGTGAVKITPAHDFNDYEVGRRHSLPMISILDEKAALNGAVPEEFQGLDRFVARKLLIQKLEELELLEKIEPNTHMVPHGEKSNVVLEPRVTEQWYVDAKTLAGPALDAVESGKIRFVPEQWTNTYYHWLRNIQPWCISRQLWWGHRIPVYYGPDNTPFVAMSEEEAIEMAAAHYGETHPLTQDPDVLDTWFSSALWPFSTLDWPNMPEDLARYYPTNVLVTGFDIIFFWVARMIMMGLHFADDIPFDTVYINAIVRDEKGQKMSKTKGNVIDPLVLADQYGADALRFTLSALAVPGRDVRFGVSQVESNRNFATKLWNAARFMDMNGCTLNLNYNPESLESPINQWVVGELKTLSESLQSAYTGYRFDEVASLLYHFTWGTFCDWYVEMIKPLLNGENEVLKREAQETAAWVLGEILKLLHPVMPYITEELWAHLRGEGAPHLITSQYPTYTFKVQDQALKDVQWLVSLITQLRATRSELNVPPGTRLPLHIQEGTGANRARVTQYGDILKGLGRISELLETPAPQGKGLISIVLEDSTFGLPLGDVVDLEAESKRLQKEVQKLEKDIFSVTNKLSNADFISKAKEEVIQENRDRLTLWTATKDRLEKAIQGLV